MQKIRLWGPGAWGPMGGPHGGPRGMGPHGGPRGMGLKDPGPRDPGPMDLHGANGPGALNFFLYFDYKRLLDSLESCFEGLDL